jgi:glutamate racemase
MDERPIGVFDSGLGGLTAVKKLTEVLPHEDIIYLGDTGRVPYGSRSRDTIIKYARQDAAFLRRFDIKAMVVACNTVSSTIPDTLPELMESRRGPVFGVVEAPVRRAVEITKNGKIGVIGTNATIRSGAYEKRLYAQAEHAGREIAVMSTPCPLFVPLVENGRTRHDDVVTKTLASEYLAEILAFGADTLILGCTHYPLLRRVIAETAGEGVTLIDSGAQTAEAVAFGLRELSLLSSRERVGTRQFFVTDSAEGFNDFASLFLESDDKVEARQIALE